jgi:hypothetical protein
MAPDGYYTYLGLDKTKLTASSSLSSSTGSASEKKENPPSRTEFDVDAVKKAYRKLSRLHHPDKGGDAETFKVLARAQRVLTNPKLREQYDILGIDLDDDNIETNPSSSSSSAPTSNGDYDYNTTGGSQDDGTKSTAEGIVQEIASTVLSGIIQLAIRTGEFIMVFSGYTVLVFWFCCGCATFVFSSFPYTLSLSLCVCVAIVMLGTVTVLLVRYQLTFYGMLLFLGYIALQLAGKASLRGGSVYETDGARTTMTDVLNPFLIAVGLILMRQGRNDTLEWSRLFWLGEATVITLFTLNSIDSIPRTMVGIGAVSVGAGLLALWFRGKFWNYTMIIFFQACMAMFIALAFPVMEMLLESILNEKLKKVGEKIRAHHRQMEKHYADKANENVTID